MPLFFPRLTPSLRRLPLAAALTLGAALLSACGGGEQREKFYASRVIVFGDEASTINDGSNPSFPRGTKFTVNAISTTTNALDCNANPLWVQWVAGYYGRSFPECDTSGATTGGGGVMRAAYGAKVADVKTQIDTFLGSGSLGKGDLVTLMAGHNDILAQIETSPRPSVAAMTAAAEQAGTLMGDQVFRVTATGAKVLIATLPDLSRTPLGIEMAAADPNDGVLLKNLTTAFNDKLRIRLADDPNGGGRSGALLSADDEIALFIVNFDNQFGFTNTVNAACTTTSGSTTSIMATATLPVGCTSNTASTGHETWLWAGRTMLSGKGQGELGERAILRLNNNPL